ncbi:hypothetical protein EDD11_002392 [Mortierella claussenii]|nr:hypothetical protein EDD11_002392 [Mortierella claussenii]
MGAAWHKACFTCRECNRRLDSNTLAEHEGEAYCKSCHKKKWGPTGYGYASGVLVPEEPESQFKQSIGRPLNSTGSNNGSFRTLDEVVTNTTGGSSAAGGNSPLLTQSRLAQQQQQLDDSEAEEQRRERLTPVNATLKKRNSLDMIREQAEASRRAYDEAHAQRVAQKYGRVNANSTGGSTTSTGSRGEYLSAGGNHNHTGANSGYLSTGSDTSSAFGSTIATTSSPAPSFSSISSATSNQQPTTRSLYLNQSLRPSTSTSASAQRQETQDAESEYTNSRQTLSFQTGAPPTSSGSFSRAPVGPPSLPKRNPEPVDAALSSQASSDQADESYLEYAPIRIVARKDDSKASAPLSAAPTVDEDEWDAEPAQKSEETAPSQPMYRSQYLQQQRQQEQEREREQQARERPSAPSVSSSSTSSARPNQLINETDRLNWREQEQRQQQQKVSASVDVDEWDEEPTPNVPSKPLNVSYMPARHVSSAATRTWTPSTNASSASTEAINSPTTTTSPVGSGDFNTTPKTNYFRSGSLMTPKKMASFGGGGDICPRCQKTVYHAESALAPGGAKYHKLCLRCVECSKSLDSTNMTDRQGAPYCKTCYGKAFGAKGYGYGSGASMLHTEL